ncbi:MAG: polyprenyl synthetase family protein [Balneolaceae bacterium]|nr:polyprenyl synthetase family protein [Balneolaceae bacterium]
MISTDIQQQISELIEAQFAKLNLPQHPESLYDPVRYTLSLGGKRIRPYLTLSGCGLCDGPIEEAIPAAIAIELLHNFTLLHDDIMDSASTRRGKPSVFRKWDASTAILSGDAMYAWAFEQLQYYGKKEQFSKTQYYKILNIFLDSAKTVCEGQAYDLDFETEQLVSLDDYSQMIRGKTAALIVGSFKMGGIVANASPEKMDQLEAIGNHVGIGFQIQDDLLDVLADPDKFGKKLGGDILEGKKTYLSILALQRGNREQQQQLHQIFENTSASQNEVEKVIDLYRQLGVIEATQKKIEKHYNEAIGQIELFDGNPYKSDLKTFLLNLKNREF